MATIREVFVSAVQHHEAGQLQQAEQLYRFILQQKANYFPALHGLGLIAYQAGYIAESIAHYRQAIALKPNFADAYNNLGLALVANGEYAAAVDSYQQAIALSANYAEAYNNLGHALRHQGKVAEAIAAYDQAIGLKPEFVSPHWNRSLALLLNGDLQQGFAEYEWRWRREGKQLRPFPQPLWDGSDLAGRRILLYAEQGFGDTIQFIRYATWAAERGGQVVVECQAPLVRLVQTVPGVQVVVAQGETLPAFDVQRPLMSLPWLHGTTLETVPVPVPYLQVPDSSSISLLSPPGNQLKVGFVWSGNPENRNNRNRSCTAADFRPLLDIPGVTLYSLQKAAQPEELAQLGAVGDRLQDLSPQLQDFGDTAAAIAQLDLVITVDTAVAHLAGALGKPVWVLLSFAPDWRWMLEREDTPWYPTMRLFRQAEYGDWAGVFTRVVAALREALNERKPGMQFNSLQCPLNPPTYSPVGHPRNGEVKKLVPPSIGGLGGPSAENLIELSKPSEYGVALLKTAIQHHQAGRLSEAEALYQQILEAQPNQAEVWQLRGALAATEKRNSDAIAYYQQALSLKPNFPEAHSNLGVVLSQTGQIETAIFHYQQAIALNPEAAELHHNLGAALKEQGRVAEAIAHYQQAIALNPNYAMTYNNLGTIWEEQGRYTEAMACYNQALAVNPEHVDARFSRAIALLRIGDLRRGFEEYEWRWRRPDMKPQAFKRPLWDGSDLSGKTILIHTEQGFGDTIQFIRYLDLVAQKGGRIVVACQQALATLIQPLPQIEQLIVEGQPIPNFDVHAPLLSLPRILGIQLESIPAQVPYLQPPAPRLTLAAPPETQLKVGLVWSGNPTHPHNQQRSCPLQQFLPLLELPGVAFYSLQKGPQIADLALLPSSSAIQDLSPQLQDFSDTAAAIAQLDLVIAIDTSVAHLAGALGKPVWLLLDTAPDWRWLTDREDSPWYPTMRLFRQTTPGNWPEVIERVGQALQKLLASRLPTPLSDLEAAIAIALKRHQTNQLEAASAVYFQVLQQDPHQLDALHLLGVIAHQKHQFDQAIAYYHQALAIAPNFAEAHANLSATLREQGQFSEAIDHCQKALALNPNFTNAYASLGLIYRCQGKLDQAIAAYNCVLEANPDDIETHWNRALAWLLGGDFTQGFTEYEWRWRRPHRRPRPFAQPLWDGSDLQGKTILLHAEQGFGDTIQFIRYAALVAERGGRVIVECQAPLLRLLSGVAGIDQLVAQETPLPDFDVHTPLLSLPRLFGTTVNTVPAAVPYLFPPTQSAVQLTAPAGHLKVGIVWSGSRTNQNNHHRSCAPHYFQALFKMPGVSFYSLQKDASVAELAQLSSEGATVEDLSPQLHDFADTAAAIAQLDLVITVDTSVAHLAGAMGKPVWVLLSFAADWRWMVEREDSPWYPTMRLFRQQQPGDWAAVVRRVQAALQTLVETPSPSTHFLPTMPQPAPEFAAATPDNTSTNVTPPPPANPKVVRPIGIGWQLSLMTGWGVYGINFTLQLQQHPHFAPMLLTPASVTSELLNPLHQVLLRPAIAQQQNLQNLLANYPNQQVSLDIPVFYALGKDFDSKLLPRVSGQRNFGVVFFEDTALKPEAIAKAKTYDAIVAGSTWNAEVLQSYGLENVYNAPQGIDPTIFHPAPKANLFRDRFVIFSGGKLEYRKGQDLLVAAFRAFRDRHPDALLLTAWHNFWPQFMLGLEQSGHVKGVPAVQPDGRLRVVDWLVANGIPADACIDVGPIPNHMVGQIIREAHVAVFPNRAEGGTNLVAMESMACGLPTILSANTGHLDLIGSDRCYALTHQKPAKSIPIFQGVEGWGESDVEEIIEALEQVYTDYQTAQAKGQAAARFMQDWTWEKQVQRCLAGLNL